MAGLPQSALREKVQAYFKAQLDQYIDWLDRRGLSKSVLDHAREELLDHQSFVDLNSSALQWLPVAQFKRKMDITDADWEASMPRIAQELRKGRRDMLRAVLEAAERQDGYSYGMASERPSPAPVTALVASAQLGKTVDEFIAEHSRQWTEKTRKQVGAYLEILIEYFGRERSLGDITRQDASELKKVLQLLPSSRNTKPALKKLPLIEVIKLTGHDKLTPKTINSHIDAFRRFFEWAERHGYATHRLFEGMKVPKARDSETQRMPFSRSQLCDVYAELSQNKSGLIRSESHKWGALLGIFTGARLNEICQLEIVDVVEEDEVWYLNITDEGDNKKRLKAKASKRKVPIHSELLKLGFLEFFESRRNRVRLFPDYSFNTNGGYGRNLGRWFNESFLPSLGMKKPGLVFHCLRHTMVTRLEQADVAEPVIQNLVGHARDGVTQAVYFKEGYTLKQLKEAIEKFSV